MSGTVSDVQETSILSWMVAEGIEVYSMVVSGNCFWYSSAVVLKMMSPMGPPPP